MDRHLASHLEALALLALPQSTGLENDDDAGDPDSVRMEKGDDDAAELLDDDVRGPITDLFQEQEHPANQGGSHELTIPSPSSRQAEISQHISEEGSDYAWDIDGDTSLHNTVISGSVEEVTRLIRNEKCNIDALDQHGRSALHVALEAAPFGMIEVLLDLGADIRIPDTEGRTPLHLASAMGNEDAIALLLDYGADTSVKDNRGQSALHVAAAEGSAQSVRTLLLYGADVEGINRKGQTPLNEAVARGDQTVIQILLLAASWYLGTTLTRENADIGSKVGAQSDEEWYLVASLLLRALQKFPQAGACDLQAWLKSVKATQKKWEVAANQIPALLKLIYYEVVILLGRKPISEKTSRLEPLTFSR
jgi:ankyrin repeat protein